MASDILEVVSGPAVKAGLEFVWLISFGQIATIAIAVLGFVAGFGKLIATVYATQKEMKQLRSDIGELRADNRELREGVKELTLALLSYKFAMLPKNPEDEK